MKHREQKKLVGGSGSVAAAMLLSLALGACTRPLSSFVIPPPTVANTSDEGVGSPERPVKVMAEGEWRAVRTGCERPGLLSANVGEVEKWLLPEGRPSIGQAYAGGAVVELRACDNQWLRLPPLGPKEQPFASDVPGSALKVDGHTTVVYIPLYSLFHDNGTDTARLEVIVEDMRDKHIVRRWRVVTVQRFGGPFG